MHVEDQDLRSLLDQRLLHSLDLGQASDPAADRDGDPACVVLVNREAGVGESQGRGADREMNEATGSPDVSVLHEITRLEVVRLAANPSLETRDVDRGNRSDAALAGEDGVPSLLGARRQR